MIGLAAALLVSVLFISVVYVLATNQHTYTNPTDDIAGNSVDQVSLMNSTETIVEEVSSEPEEQPSTTSDEKVASLNSSGSVIETPPPRISVDHCWGFEKIYRGESTEWCIYIENIQRQPTATVKVELSFWNAPDGITYSVTLNYPTMEYDWGTPFKIRGTRYRWFKIGVKASPTADLGDFRMGIDIYLITDDGDSFVSHLTSGN